MTKSRQDSQLIDALEKCHCDLAIGPAPNGGGWLWRCSDGKTYSTKTCREAIKARLFDANPSAFKNFRDIRHELEKALTHIEKITADYEARIQAYEEMHQKLKLRLAEDNSDRCETPEDFRGRLSSEIKKQEGNGLYLRLRKDGLSNRAASALAFLGIGNKEGVWAAWQQDPRIFNTPRECGLLTQSEIYDWAGVPLPFAMKRELEQRAWRRKAKTAA